MIDTNIIILLLFSGISGGVINFFLMHDGSGNWKWLLTKAIVLGIGASFVIPLFLKIISSNLLLELYVGYNWLILISFCLLASIYSRRFLEDIYDRVIKAENKAEHALEKTQELEEIKTEVDNLDEKILKVAANSKFSQGEQFSEAEIEKVVNAIRFSSFSYRTTDGIAKEHGIEKEKVKIILEYLLGQGLALKRNNSEGKPVWRINIDKISKL